MIITVALALILLLTLISIAVLIYVDLKEFMLPNEFVFIFGAMGFAFHAFHQFSILPLSALIIGAICGGALLWIIRFFANRHYQSDTLGLGDVKLLFAGGLWLGFEGIFIAITLGAIAGLLHGLILAMIQRVSPSGLIIPAGPGFIVGLIATAIIQLPLMKGLLL